MSYRYFLHIIRADYFFICVLKCSVGINARAQQWAHTLGSTLYENCAKATAIMDIKTVSIFVDKYYLPKLSGKWQHSVSEQS